MGNLQIYNDLTEEGIRRLYEQAKAIAVEFSEKAALKPGQLVVVGCSTSEVLGKDYGTYSHPQAGDAIWRGLAEIFCKKGIFIAAQCCEHLNRALIVEEEIAKEDQLVSVVPQPKAGGSFATAAWRQMRHPVAQEYIRADAGLDIGGTMVGMHLKPVAVPFRLAQNHLGEAMVLSAYTRPKYIGGARAVYAPPEK